jgi:hypothetical protein
MAPDSVELVTFRPDGMASGTESRYERQTSYSANRYDADGRLTEIESWVDAGPKMRAQFRYDAGGRPAESFLVNANGTRQQTETFSYGIDGRRTRVQFNMFAALPDDVDSDEPAWQTFIPHVSSPEPSPQIATVVYDSDHRPAEVLIHSAQHELRYRVTFTRDREGHLLTGETTIAGIGALGPEFEQALAEASPEERAQAEAELETVFEKFLSVSFTYDGTGRLLEEVRRMGTLMERVTTHRYDARGALVEETSVERSHGVDGDGPDFRETPEQRHEQRTRFEYQYDAQGNWTERVTWSQGDANPEFQRSAVERRAFTYYPG